LIIESYELLLPQRGREGGREGGATSVPPRFIDGCQGDLVEAKRRWDITRAWREEWEVRKEGRREGGREGGRVFP